MKIMSQNIFGFPRESRYRARELGKFILECMPDVLHMQEVCLPSSREELIGSIEKDYVIFDGRYKQAKHESNFVCFALLISFLCMIVPINNITSILSILVIIMLLGITRIVKLSSRMGDLDFFGQIIAIKKPMGLNANIIIVHEFNEDGYRFSGKLYPKLIFEYVFSKLFLKPGFMAVEVDQILFINVHLVSGSSETTEVSRIMQCRYLMEFVRESCFKKIIIAGDFNMDRFEYGYKIITTENGFHDAGAEENYPTCHIGSGNCYTVPSSPPNQRIDYIFYKGDLKKKHIFNLKSVQEFTDHQPVVGIVK